MQKLVRDRIPDIMRADHVEPVTRAPRDWEEMLRLLREKMREELGELLDATTRDERIREAADLLTAVDAYLRQQHISPDEVRGMKERLLAERGGFENGIILVTEDDDQR